MRQTQNLLDVLDLLVLHDLVVTRLTDVQDLTAQRENSKVVSPDDVQTGDGKCLGGVSFREDESAVLGVLGTGIVSIGKFGKPSQSIKIFSDAYQSEEKTPTCCACYRQSS